MPSERNLVAFLVLLQRTNLCSRLFVSDSCRASWDSRTIGRPEFSDRGVVKLQSFVFSLLFLVSAELGEILERVGACCVVRRERCLFNLLLLFRELGG